MASQTSSNDTFTSEGNKLIVKMRFYDTQQRYGFINIDPRFIEKLDITSDTILTQEITEQGVLLRRFEESV